MKDIFLNYLLSNMTLSKKIAQMIIIDSQNKTELTTPLEQLLTNYQFGGFILFENNISQDYNHTKAFIKDIKDASQNPFIAIDEEGGKVKRISPHFGINNIPSMLELANDNDPITLYQTGIYIGYYLNELGINMNLAPVLDILSNPNNFLIGSRAFGNEPKTVSMMSLALAAGLKHHRIIGVGKHYPGHGDTEIDSHQSIPIINKNYQELLNNELIPFIDHIKQKIPAILVGHLALPKINNSYIPATMSEILIKDILRKELNYNGLIITDSLKMKSITDNYTEKDIYINTIKSNNDILLMPNDPIKALNNIYSAVNNGIIPIEQIDQSVLRILRTKLDYHLLDQEYNNFKKNIKIKKLNP